MNAVSPRHFSIVSSVPDARTANLSTDCDRKHRAMSKVVTTQRDRLVTELGSLDIFLDADGGTRTMLSEGSQLRSYAPDELILREGERPRHLFGIVDGLVALGAHHHERETTLSLVERGRCLLLQAVVTDRVYLQSAKAITSATVLAIPAGKFRAAIARDPGLAMATMRAVASDHRDAIRDLKNIKLRSNAERLANWILENTQDDGRLELAINKKLLAERLGMTPESLSRCLRVLKPFGLVNHRDRLEVSDAALLRTFALPNSLIDQGDGSRLERRATT